MKPTKILILIGATLTGGMLMQQSTLAGGLSLYEIGTPDIGLASAGYAARAQDASTLFKNPAGMSLLDGAQAQAGIQALYGNVRFTKNSSTTPSLGNNNGDNAIGTLPGLSAFVTCPVTDKLTVGFGTFSYFGLSEDYGNNWVGRYYVQKATLVGVSLMPAASFKVNDWLSVGGGLNAMFGYLDAQTAVNNIIGPDGRMTVKDQTWGFGGNGGILIQPRSGTRIGVTYLSEVKLDFSAKPNFSGLGPGLSVLLAHPPQLNLGMTVPQSVMAGIYQELNAKWAVMADVGWQQWSRFGEVAVGINTATPGGPKDFTTQLNYQDTWHGAIGAEYKASEEVQFTGGFAYDTSAVSDANRTVTVPMGEAYRFGIGMLWKITQTVDLGTAYEFLWAGNMPVNQPASAYRGTISGSFNNTYFMFFTLNLNWHF